MFSLELYIFAQCQEGELDERPWQPSDFLRPKSCPKVTHIFQSQRTEETVGSKYICLVHNIEEEENIARITNAVHVNL